MRPLFRELSEPVLFDQNYGRSQQRAQTYNPLQPEIRSRIKFGHATPGKYGIGEHPERNKEQNDAEKNRLPDKMADAFQDTLRATDLLLFTRVELQNGLDILADLVAFGFDWCVTWGRRQLRRNGRFGFHQGMLLLIGSGRCCRTDDLPLPHMSCLLYTSD